MSKTNLCRTTLLFVLVCSACNPKIDARSPEIAESEFRVRVAYSTQSPNGNSRGHTTLQERIVENSHSGLTVEYDFVPETNEEAKLREWRYPAQLRILPDQTIELLNPFELDARSIDWRKRAGIAETACGQWHFTWNAFKIECDVQTVASDLEPYNLHFFGIENEWMLQEPGTIRPQALSVVQEAPLILTASFEIDPESVRRERAEQEMIVSLLIESESLSFDEAFAKQATNMITGTLTTTLYLDEQRRVIKRIRNSEISVTDSTGTTEDFRYKQTTTRELLTAK